MSTWLVPRSELTVDQLRVVEASPTKHRLVFGLAGSGKTQVLVHRAAFLRERYSVQDNTFRIFILTNVLRDYIRSGVAFLGLPDAAVSTFDAWCVDFYQNKISRSLPWNSTTRSPDFPKIRRLVLRFLRANTNSQEPFSFVLVDEGQDLTNESFEILKLISRHVTVFADYLQQIYEGGAEIQNIADALGVSPQKAFLLGTYRNSPDVAQLASYFISDRQRRAEYLSQVKSVMCERERPLLYVARDLDDEIDRLASIIQQRQFKNQRVGIIVPTNRHVHGLTTGLGRRGIVVEKAVPPPVKTRGTAATFVQFDSMAPKIASYHSAKGLTFDCVLMPRLTENAFSRIDGERRKRLLFVGMARAMQWIYLSTDRKTLREMAILEDAISNNHLVIQKSDGPQDVRLDKAAHVFDDDDGSSLL